MIRKLPRHCLGGFVVLYDFRVTGYALFLAALERRAKKVFFWTERIFFKKTKGFLKKKYARSDRFSLSASFFS